MMCCVVIHDLTGNRMTSYSLYSEDFDRAPLVTLDVARRRLTNALTSNQIDGMHDMLCSFILALQQLTDSVIDRLRIHFVLPDYLPICDYSARLKL
jgi:hypothetical protein